MEKDKFNKTFKRTVDDIKTYINLKTELYTLILIERSSKIFSKFLAVIIFFFMMFFVLLFLSLAFVHWFAALTGELIASYLLVAFLYLLMGLLVYLFRRKLFLNPMLKGFTDELFEKEDLLDKKLNREEDEED